MEEASAKPNNTGSVLARPRYFWGRAFLSPLPNRALFLLAVSGKVVRMDDFDLNDRVAIQGALIDRDPNNPIAAAVANRIQEFTHNLAIQAVRNGEWPKELLLYRPQTVFDEVVIRVTLQSVATQLGHEIAVHWLPSR